MSTLSLGYLVMRLRLDRMDHVRKFNCILNKKDRDVVSDQVPVALLSEKLNGEASYVSNSVLANGCQTSA